MVMEALTADLAHFGVNIPQSRKFSLDTPHRLNSLNAAPHAPDPAFVQYATDFACEFVLGADGCTRAFMIVTSHHATPAARPAAALPGTMIVRTIPVPGATPCQQITQEMTVLKTLQEMAGNDPNIVITTAQMRRHDVVRQLLNKRQDDGSAGSNGRVLSTLVDRGFLWNDTSEVRSGRYMLTHKGASVTFD
jgi:hypothetical protein